MGGVIRRIPLLKASLRTRFKVSILLVTHLKANRLLNKKAEEFVSISEVYLKTRTPFIFEDEKNTVKTVENWVWFLNSPFTFYCW